MEGERKREMKVNQISSECTKLTQTYKNRNDLEIVMIHWELCKQLIFDLTKKEGKCINRNFSVKLTKFLRDFEIKAIYLIQNRKADLIV